METNVSRSHLNLRLLTAAIALVGLAGCNLKDQSAPDLTGPSTLGRSVTLTASPDRILYDGSSVVTITATVRNAAGSPEPNVGLHWDAGVVTVSNGTRALTSVPVEAFPQITTTNANGVATTTVRAPIAPDVMPTGVTFLEVAALPIGDDASQLAPGVDAKPRFISVELVPQTGANAPDRLPIPEFTMSPPVANINQTVTLDASLTRDEGVLCGDRCTYTWDFGANAGTKTGRVVTVSFPTAGARTVRLTVTDDKGFSATKTATLTVVAPTVPTASFFVVPTSPRVGQSASFDASASSVGAGATIVSYTWDFGELGATGTGKTTAFAYTVAGAKTVTLTVTDDLGRTAQTTATVTVIP
jgi:PKD repeat protein